MNVDLILERLLAKAPQFVYAILLDKEASQIALRFTTDDKPSIERLDNTEERNMLWQAFTRVMREQCLPPCIQISSDIVFQPAYLLRVAHYANEQGYFVVLDFGENRNLCLGNNERAKQVILYEKLIRILGIEGAEKLPPLN